MSKRGFVYVMSNPWMPDLYKVGCTERSPHERAAELSNHTGVPAPFKVVCYIECEEFQAIEQAAHKWLGSYRVSNGREFFSECLCEIVRFLWWHPRRLTFCDATLSPFGSSELLLDDEIPCAFEDLPNPWELRPDPVVEPTEPTPLKLVANSDGFE